MSIVISVRVSLHLFLLVRNSATLSVALTQTYFSQLTETGVLGANGIPAVSRVGREPKPGHVNVTVHLPNMAAVPVLVLILKTAFVRLDPVQVSVHWILIICLCLIKQDLKLCACASFFTRHSNAHINMFLSWSF